MKIFIDADGCPVVKITEKIAQQYGVPCVIVCDSAHAFNSEYSEVIVTATGADSADYKLVNMLSADDIVITQDYGLATMCLAKGARVLNQNGLIYNDSNIDTLLLSRHLNRRARNAGVRIRGPKKRTVQQDIQFEQTLESIVG